MRITATARTLTFAVLTATAVAACSSTSNGNPTTGPSSPPAQSTAQSPAPSASSFPSSSSQSVPSGGLTQARAQAALLTAAEVGGGFVQTQTDDTDTPLPCTPNDPPLSQAFPPNLKVQADFGGLDGKALFSEEIESFADTDTVAQVIAAGEHGLSCGTTTVSGTQVKIEGPTDLTAQVQVPVDKVEAWSVTSSALNASLVIAQIGTQLVVFSFGAAPSVETSKLPDAATLIRTGLAKVNAALK